MINKIKQLLLKSSLVIQIYGKYQNRVRSIFHRNKKRFEGKKGIEIGGPSKVFSSNGAFPIYPILDSLDNINFNDDNFWSSIEEGNNFFYEKNKKEGKQIIADAINLSRISNESYEIMLSSHVLEHVANPLKALNEWKRILKIDGYLVIILPDMRYTYDRKRPLTTFSHIEKDFRYHIQEDDSTHFQEILDLHDLTNDGTVSSYEEHKVRTLNNLETRIVHHHTFDINLVFKMLDFCGFEICDSQVFRPYHLMAVAKKVGS
jgi:SAM-dependent methyltransferase